MIDLECPHCGRVGSVPRDKTNVRLLCKKCHMPFHLGPAGRAIPGDPPVAREKDHGHSHAQAHPAASTRVDTGASSSPRSVRELGLIGVLAALLICGGGFLGYGRSGAVGRPRSCRSPSRWRRRWRRPTGP